MFPGIMRGWKIAFLASDKVRELVSGVVESSPKHFSMAHFPPLFLADGAGFSADTGADEQDSAEKNKPGTTRPRERV